MSNKNIEKKLADDIVDFFKNPMCATYRKTFEEEKICAILQNIAKNIDGVKVIREEESKNLIIWKKGNGKYQSADFPVILQAHMDMVCVASEQGDEREIFKNGIATYSPAGFPNKLMGRSAANENILTSLGADNGIGVAAIFAILQNTEIVHPPLVAIITAEEEDGMGGAEKLKYENIKTAADDMNVDLKKAKLINIDEEQDGIFSVSCAGSIRGTVSLPLKRKCNLPENAEYCTLSISGLSGGHSGLVINENRANAIVILCDVLEKLQYTNLNLEIISLDKCGVAPNAIPSNASAVIAIRQGTFCNLKKRLAHVQTYIQKNYNLSDANLKINAEICDNINLPTPYTNETQTALCSVVRLIPNGVIAWFANDASEPTVETSNNIGIIKETKNTNGNEHIEITCMIRSADDDMTSKVAEVISARCKTFGGEFAQSYNSPAWKYREKNSLRDLFLDKYKQVSGREAKAVAIHAGLECGHFAKVFGGIDMIACGPQLSGVHSINETLYLDTVPTFAKLLIAVLEDI